jgi:hypothetical protein
MRELPILFSTPMVQAIQAGTKNQTRRTAGLGKVNENPDDWEFLDHLAKTEGVFKFYPKEAAIDNITECKPRYQKGDKIWVKETFTIIPVNSIVYRADYTLEPKEWFTKWKSSLFMRKEYARTWLECTGVRCERADSISEADAINEGIGERKSQLNQKSCYLVPGSTANWAVDTATEAFKHLWNSINLNPKPIQEKVDGKLKTTGYICFPFDNSSVRIYYGKTTWRGKPLTVIANPWVFIYDFKRIEKP